MATPGLIRPRACFPLALGALLGLAAATAIVAFLVAGESLPRLDRETFDAAWERWQQSGPASYHIRIRVEGRRPAIYEVRVQQNEVLSATCNGQPLKDARTVATWSVPGMFDTIEYDVRAVDGSGSPPANLGLRAMFEPQLGYPMRYRRTDYSSNIEVEWEVLEFRTLPAPSESPSESPSGSGSGSAIEERGT